jgi:type IV pilus assembly protein PilQ
VLALVLLATLAPAPPPDRESLVALDVKDASVTDVAAALAEAGGYQAVFDPGLSCRLTLKLNGAAYAQAFETVLRACGLAFEGEGTVLRIAKSGTLLREASERRRLQEEKLAARPRREVVLRLSYARASEMAPILKRHLSPAAVVAFDERTNTLIFID